ncbi:hypothetical protein N2152v2_005786 [Parachlorella kessleri]
MADGRGSTLDPWAQKPRTSLGSPEGAAAVGVTIERHTSSFVSNRSSVQGGKARRRRPDSDKSSVLGMLGLGSSFFKGNVKDELKKQEYNRAVNNLVKRDSSGSSSRPSGTHATRDSVRSSVRVLDRMMPWRNKNRVASYVDADDALARDSVVEGMTEEEAQKRASTLSISNQVLEALQSVGPSLRQASIAEAMQDEDKRMSWMNKLMGNTYQLARQEEGDSEGEEGGEGEGHGLQEEVEEVVINPLSAFRARWDLLIVLAIFYSCATLPLRAAFGDNQVGPFFMFDMGLTVFFLVDIILNFNTGYDDDGIIVMEKSRVRWYYLRTWFMPDLIASIPYDLIALLAKQGDLAAYLRLLRLVRMTRLPRLFKYISRWEDVLPINSFAMRMAKLGTVILIFAHTNACLQLLVGKVEPANNNWLLAEGVYDASKWTQYSHALFRAISHMITIGYGLAIPVNVGEVWMVMASMLTGAMMYAVLLGMINSMMQSMDRSGSLYVERMQMWKEYWRSRRVPKDLRKRIISSLNQKHRGRKIIDEDVLLRDITPNLRADIYMHICEDLVRNVPVFQACRPPVIRVLVPNLVQEVYPPGEVVFNEGEIATHMYFIRTGTVQIYRQEDPDNPITQLSAGSYFGEFAILAGQVGTRTACAQAVTFVELYSLSRSTFDRVAAHYPEVLELFRFIAEARQAINENRPINADAGGGGSRAAAKMARARAGSYQSQHSASPSARGNQSKHEEAGGPEGAGGLIKSGPATGGQSSPR